MKAKARWEYKIINLSDCPNNLEQAKQDNQIFLDMLGLEGWELVTIRKNLGYFKRRFVDKNVDLAYVVICNLKKRR